MCTTAVQVAAHAVAGGRRGGTGQLENRLDSLANRLAMLAMLVNRLAMLVLK